MKPQSFKLNTKTFEVKWEKTRHYNNIIKKIYTYKKKKYKHIIHPNNNIDSKFWAYLHCEIQYRKHQIQGQKTNKHHWPTKQALKVKKKKKNLNITFHMSYK